MAILGYEKLTVADSAVSLASVPTGSTEAYIQAADANVRLRFDGTAPTAAEGVTLTAAGSIKLKGGDVLNGVQFIRTASTDANLYVVYGSATSGIASDMDAV